MPPRLQVRASFTHKRNKGDGFIRHNPAFGIMALMPLST
jgi:hypothetical protein